MWLNNLFRRAKASAKRDRPYCETENYGATFRILPANPPKAPPGAALVLPAYPEAQRIADSLRDCSGDWLMERSGHYLTHVPTGFKLWCANDERGVAEWDGHKRIEYSDPEKRIIWRALESLAKPKPQPFGALPKVRITAQRGTFWCFCEGHPWAGAGDSPAQAYRSWSRAISIQARKDDRPNEILHVWSAAQ